MSTPRIVIIGAGIGGLTTAALLAKAGYAVTVLEAQTYPGGCAGTFYHKGYRFDAGATLAGGFQSNGPHSLLAEMLDLKWQVQEAETAWIVHLPDRAIPLTKDGQAVVENFPQARAFWEQQQQVADLCWAMAADGLPFPPTSVHEAWQLAKVGLKYFPRDLQLARYAFASVTGWLQRHHLADDPLFKRFIDGQLLISAQTTADNANALYGATALDLARQGVQHVVGGMGGLAETLVDKIREWGGEVLYRQTVTQIEMKNGRAIGVQTRHGNRAGEFFPADIVIGNLTPWSLDKLLGRQADAKSIKAGWGAFVLHLGVDTDKLPADIADHHQILPSLEGKLGEGNSLFLSMSPPWDESRVPQGKRAVTLTTHTAVQQWWDLLAHDPVAYAERKASYTEKILNTVERFIPNFKASVALTLPGTPVTYQFYTQRHLGMVGGFPQQALWQARSPRVGVENVRLVGDSIFPGQSTAAVTLGAMRVALDVQHTLGASTQKQHHWIPEREA